MHCSLAADPEAEQSPHDHTRQPRYGPLAPYSILSFAELVNYSAMRLASECVGSETAPLPFSRAHVVTVRARPLLLTDIGTSPPVHSPVDSRAARGHEVAHSAAQRQPAAAPVGTRNIQTRVHDLHNSHTLHRVHTEYSYD